MNPMFTISACTLLALASLPAAGQQMMNLDGDYILPLNPITFRTHPIEINRSYHLIDPMSDELIADLSDLWLDPTSTNFTLRHLSLEESMHRLSDNDQSTISSSLESWADTTTNAQGVNLNNSLSFAVGRSTELRDGNISGSEGTLGSEVAREHVASIAQSEGEYDVYDLSLEWKAIDSGPLTFSVLSGFKAIEANIGKRITKDGDTTLETVNRFAAVPMIGSGVRWQINDAFSFSGSAMTHPIDAGDTLIDFNASTDFQFSTNVGFSAGYHMIRSSFEVGSVDTSVEQEGLFARLQISF